MPRFHSVRLLLAACICCLCSSTSRAAEASLLAAALESITVKDLKQHVNVLASDTLEGREAGSRGGKAAGAYLIETLKKLEVTPGGDSSFYQHFGADYRNVLVLLPGSDPELKDEYVVISSHYDHVGYGTSRNSYGPIGRIHNGADDNASGTAGVLELIEALAAIKPAPRRSILFAFWDAEEKGLLGSEHWVAHPTVPLKQVKLMVNIDMIGRLRNDSLEIFGVGTAAGLRRMLCEQNRSTDLTLDFNLSNVRDSDHYPFYARRIPYLMFHTRKHDNYHRPSDDVDTLNLEGLLQVTRLMCGTLYAAADAAELSAFRKDSIGENFSFNLFGRSQSSTRPKRLAVDWDERRAAEGVIEIVRVQSGSSAEKSGLQVGDRILQFGPLAELNAGHAAQAGMFTIALLAASSPAKVVVERKGAAEPVELEVTLEGKPERIGISFVDDSGEPGIVRITRVTPGSAADAAGLKVNHRIYEVAGRRFGTRAEFQDLVTTLPGPLKLLVEGTGRLREIELKLLPTGESSVTEDDTNDSP